MAASVGDLVANLNANTTGFTKGLQKARGELGGFSSFASSVLSGIGAGVGLGSVAALASGLKSLAGSAMGTVKEMVSLAATAESNQVAFSTMLGSAEKAKTVLSQITDLAAKTPLETSELVSAGRSLIAFKHSAEEVVPTLRMLGDISSGVQQPIGEIAEIYGKARVQGRLFAEDINQFTGRGIPIIQELAKQFGVGDEKVRKLVEDGKVGFPHLQKAFMALTADGGKFHGMMEAQSHTLAGLWSTAKDNVAIAMKGIGETIVESFGLKELLQDSNSFAETFQSSWLPAIQGTVQAAGEVFRGTITLMREAWDGWLGESVKTVQYAVSNWDLLWGIAGENVKLFVSNIPERFKTAFVNIGELFNWMAENWHDVLFTMGDFAMTVFINMGQNIRNIFGEVFDYLASFGEDAIDIQAHGLTEGFKSTLSEMPKFSEAQIQQSTPELERLYSELGRREAEANAKAQDQTAKAVAKPGDLKVTDTFKSDKKGHKQTFGAALEGSKEAIGAIAAATNAGRKSSPLENLTKQSVDQLKKINTGVEKLGKTPAVTRRAI